MSSSAITFRRLVTAGCKSLRNRGELAHDAVDAGADEQALALRREVDVGGAQLDRAAEDGVHLLGRGRARGRLAEIDDGGAALLGRLGLVVEVELVGIDAA